MLGDSASIIVLVVLIVFGLGLLLRPDWFYIPGADPVSQRIRARHRTGFCERHK